jgi:hypothetical protein
MENGMGRVFTIVSTAVISAAITSAFWLLAFNSGDGRTRRDKIVKPGAQRYRG